MKLGLAKKLSLKCDPVGTHALKRYRPQSEGWLMTLEGFFLYVGAHRCSEGFKKACP